MEVRTILMMTWGRYKEVVPNLVRGIGQTGEKLWEQQGLRSLQL